MLFNSVHCLQWISNLGVSRQPFTVHFALTLGVVLLVRLHVFQLFNETIQINQTCFCWKVKNAIGPFLPSNASVLSAMITTPLVMTPSHKLPIILTKIPGISSSCKACLDSVDS